MISRAHLLLKKGLKQVLTVIIEMHDILVPSETLSRNFILGDLSFELST